MALGRTLPTMARVGIISDTHGLLRPEALAFLGGCQHIVHGGDIGTAEVLAELAAIAPVTAVRGNNDRGTWADALKPSSSKSTAPTSTLFTILRSST